MKNKSSPKNVPTWSPRNPTKALLQFPKYIHYDSDDDDNAQMIVADKPNLYKKFMHKQMELQREKDRPERKRPSCYPAEHASNKLRKSN